MAWCNAGFGQSGMAFGAASQQPAPRGTRAIPFAKTKETEQAGLPGNSKPTQPGEFLSISAMPAYQTKCFEELRMEDYQVRLGGSQSAKAVPCIAVILMNSNMTSYPSAWRSFAWDMANKT